MSGFSKFIGPTYIHFLGAEPAFFPYSFISNVVFKEFASRNFHDNRWDLPTVSKLLSPVTDN